MIKLKSICSLWLVNLFILVQNCFEYLHIPFFYMFEQVWSTSEMVHVFCYSGAVTVFISKYCQITYAFILLHCILFSVELSFKAIKYVSTSFFSCHWKIKSWTLLNSFYFFCTILGHNKLCIFTYQILAIDWIFFS